jgi:hypothetical protein
MRKTSVLVMMACLAGCAAEEGGPAMATRQDCHELRAIEAKLVLASAEPKQGSSRVNAELARHENSLATVGGDDAIVACTKERTAASVDCARRAKTLVELEDCARR